MAPKNKPTNNISINLEDLKSALAEQSQEILGSLTAKISELKDIIKNQAEQIRILEDRQTSLENRIVHQEVQLAHLDNNSRKEFAIIHGIPEDNTSLETIVKKLDLKIDNDFEPIRLGIIKQEQTYRPIKIKFKNETTKINNVKSASSKIKSSPNSYKNISINYDQNKLYRLENLRLRNVRKRLLEKYPDKIVKLYRGKVLLDNIEVDSFDLNKQLSL